MGMVGGSGEGSGCEERDGGNSLELHDESWKWKLILKHLNY